MAQPGQIVLAGASRRLIGELFRLTDLGRQAVKGFAEPVEPFVVEGVVVTESRFEAARRPSRLEKSEPLTHPRLARASLRL